MRSMVEGSARRQNMTGDVIEIAQNVSRLDPQNPDPLRAQPGIPPLVMLHLPGMIMSTAIYLDSQPRRSTVEIQHIRSSGMLAVELQAAWSHSQPLPKRDFRW